jgi:predicted metal-dependent phosphoesterase TrpH
MRPTFDLQSHSVHSDGALPAAEVVRLAAQDGLGLFSLSDHDTVDGIEEALEEARRHSDMRLVTAVEISSVQDEHEDLHVLGYGIDHTDSRLLERLEAFRADRDGRAGRMSDALKELGWEIDESTLDARRAAGKPIGRPHLAQAVYNHPANARRIREEDLEDFSALLVAYLIPGAPAFRRRTFPGVEEAIGVIHDAGGVAIWAHPFWDVEADEEVLATIERFKGWGLDGVEAYYVTHTREQTLLVADTCEELGLITTGSSDFHGPEHRHFARFRAHELHGREPDLSRIAALARG